MENIHPQPCDPSSNIEKSFFPAVTSSVEQVSVLVFQPHDKKSSIPPLFSFSVNNVIFRLKAEETLQ